MKNKKMNLNELKVKSFVTGFEDVESNTVKGGVTAFPACRSISPNTSCVYTIEPCEPIVPE